MVKFSTIFFIIVPTPEVVVSRSQNNSTLLAGSHLTIFCNITVDPNIDTPFIVDTVWTSIDSNSIVETINSSSGRVTVYDPESTGFNHYQSRVEFTTLSSIEDPGLYRCEVVIDSNSNYTFVYDSIKFNNTTTFEVVGRLLIRLFIF